MGDIISLTQYTTDMDAFMAAGDIRKQFFKEPYPVTTTVQVTRLYDPDLLMRSQRSPKFRRTVSGRRRRARARQCWKGASGRWSSVCVPSNLGFLPDAVRKEGALIASLEGGTMHENDSSAPRPNGARAGSIGRRDRARAADRGS
jgi:hypothetical protein